MDQLATYAAFAEIFGAIAIVGGGVFGLFQIHEFRQRRRSQVAAELCRAFAEPELARAVALLLTLPDNADLQTVREAQAEAAAQQVGMSFETMGLLVYRNVASFEIVQELTGGLLLMMWRKIGVWAEAVREEQDNPRFGEWVQWLADRIAEREPEIQPAHIAHVDWRPTRS